jgi:hypothetical protein
MSVPYTFASATGSIPLAELDTNFATPITLGSTPMILGATYTTISGLTLSNPTITGAATFGGFSIQQSGSKLYIYYGSTAVLSLDNSGNLKTLGSQSAGGTP